jgi:hypothetical protein
MSKLPTAGYLPQGYKQSTRVTRVPGPVDIRQRAHWDGSLDAKVRPGPISVRLDSPSGRPIITGQGVVFNPAMLFAQRSIAARARRMLAREDGAITASGLFIPTWLDLLDTTQLAIDLDLETHKGALFTDAVVPNFSTDTAYAVAPYNASETSGGSWTSGGVALTTTVFTEAVSGKGVFDGADVSVATTDIASAMGYLLYADVLVGNNAICLVDFITAVSTTNGTFTITWTAPGSGGIFNIDLTP